LAASRGDGGWSDTGATTEFVIAPAFYQTWWFKTLYAVAALGSLWLIYLVRLRRATAQVQQQLGARMEERERIARELHDTLLQGFQGLMLRFQAVMKMLPAQEPAYQMMESVLDRADEVLLEGRQSVRDIREEGTTGAELAATLVQCGEELAREHASFFSLTIVGEAQAVGPVVFDELCRIGREALINAFRHAHAMKIEVEIIYNESGLCLRIRDDGEGIDEAILSKGRSGHWGLSGMRERARKIGAKLDIWSNPGAGTEIELRISAELAYPCSKPESVWNRFMHIFRRQREV
jgi:signal transduction histidine kinase